MNKLKIMYRFITAGISIVLIIGSAVMAFAGDSLLSAGASKITADSSLNFCLNLDNLPDEMKGDNVDYSISLSITPKVSQMSVKEGVGNLNPVNGEYQANSDQLSGVSKLHFTIVPDTTINQDTVYTVSASIVGGAGQANDSFTFTAVASSNSSTDKDKDKSKNDKDIEEYKDKNGHDNNMPGDGNKKAVGSGNSLILSSSETSSAASVTYEGSWDNYLKKLYVDGYDFTQEFNKTRDTYFVTVPKGTKSLSVSATASDNSAIVAIAGNEDLETGRNKIMVSVTADDGSVRVYRIYATVESY